MLDVFAGKEQPRKQLRQALESVGLEAGSRRHPDPSRAEIAETLASTFLDKGISITATAYARPAGETESTQLVSGYMQREDLTGPQVITWHDWNKGRKFTLVPENKDVFEKAACRYTIRQGEKPLELTLPVMDYFITRHLDWKMDAYRAADDVLKLAHECANL